MAIVTLRALQCDVCGHKWLQDGPVLPAQCPKRSCRSRLWNAGAKKAVKRGPILSRKARLAVALGQKTVAQVYRELTVEKDEYSQ